MLQSAITRWHFLLAFCGLGFLTFLFGIFIYSLVNNDHQPNVLPAVPERAGVVLEFWFGSDEGDIRLNENRLQLWQDSNDIQVETMAQKFIHDIKMTSNGDNNHWSLHPRGRLALILLLGTISEKLHQPMQALELGQKAIDFSLDGIRKNQDVELSLIERLFFYQPLLQDESLALQNRAVALYERLLEIAPDEDKPYFETWWLQAKTRRDTIYQFGRFPERNQMLGRESTELEKRYLEQKNGFDREGE